MGAARRCVTREPPRGYWIPVTRLLLALLLAACAWASLGLVLAATGIGYPAGRPGAPASLSSA